MASASDPGPVTLEQAKAQRRIASNDEDALHRVHLTAAIGWVERYTGKLLSPRVMTQPWSDYPRPLTFYREPVIEVLGVSYADAAGTVVSVSGWRWQAGAPLHAGSGPGWPWALDRARVEVRYRAGYPDGEAPQELVVAALMMFGHFDANREAVAGGTPVEVPIGVKALCDPFRGVRLG